MEKGRNMVCKTLVCTAALALALPWCAHAALPQTGLTYFNDFTGNWTAQHGEDAFPLGGDTAPTYCTVPGKEGAQALDFAGDVHPWGDKQTALQRAPQPSPSPSEPSSAPQRGVSSSPSAPKTVRQKTTEMAPAASPSVAATPPTPLPSPRAETTRAPPILPTSALPGPSPIRASALVRTTTAGTPTSSPAPPPQTPVGLR